MIFTKAKLIMWGARFLGVAAIVGAIWGAGLKFGLDQGYDRALKDYQKALDEYNMEWYNTLYERDDQWRAEIQNTYNELQQQIKKYQEVERREQELLYELAVLETTLNDIRNEYENTDLGVCDISPEFDRLLNDAHKAATTRPN